MGQRYEHAASNFTKTVLWYGPFAPGIGANLTSDSRVFVGGAEFITMHYGVDNVGTRIQVWTLSASETEGGALTQFAQRTTTAPDLGTIATIQHRVASLPGPWISMNLAASASGALTNLITTAWMTLWLGSEHTSIADAAGGLKIAEIGVS